MVVAVAEGEEPMALGLAETDGKVLLESPTQLQRQDSAQRLHTICRFQVDYCKL
jgi:hypothetical protein